MAKLLNGYKVYTRPLNGMNSDQVLYVNPDNNEFIGIENVANGGHITKGFLPNEYETGKIMPRGFLAKLGFKPMNVTRNMEDYSQVCYGDQTGKF